MNIQDLNVELMTLTDEDQAILLSKGYDLYWIKYINDNLTTQEQKLVIGLEDKNDNNNGIFLKDIFAIRDIENQTLFDKMRDENTQEENEELSEQLEFIYDKLFALMERGVITKEITDYYKSLRSENDDLGVGLRKNKKRSKKRRKPNKKQKRSKKKKIN